MFNQVCKQVYNLCTEVETNTFVKPRTWMKYHYFQTTRNLIGRTSKMFQ